MRTAAERLKKLADKSTKGPWSAIVRDTDCIIFPSSEKNEEEQTIIFENQFPDQICRHNTRFIVACRNYIDGFVAESIKLLDSVTWHNASLDTSDLPLPYVPCEVLIDGYPTTGILKEFISLSHKYRAWISYFDGQEIKPEYWRKLPVAGPTPEKAKIPEQMEEGLIR